MLIGGKTGTGEKVPRGSGNYVVSFIGFAPVDDPQVVVYVVVDERMWQTSHIAHNPPTLQRISFHKSYLI